MKNINENIKKYRMNKGFTQQEVADKLYVTRQCISQWEQGKSVPDLDTLERLSKILEVTINDIIDDESIKSLTINEAIKNQKRKKIIWMSLIISFVSLLIVIGFIILNGNDSEEVNNEPVIYVSGLITEYDLFNHTIQFTRNDDTSHDGETYTFNIQHLDILDNQLKEITLQDLKVGDTVQIGYKKELKNSNLSQITVIDSKVEKSLWGVVVVANGKEYKTYDDIQNNETPGIRYYLFKLNNSGFHEMNNAGVGETSSNITDIEFYRNYTFEMNVYMNPLKVINDIKIGLVYSTGIEYVDTLNLLNLKNLTFKGEVDYEPLEPYFVHSVDVTYKINFNRVYSFDSIEVYEYDHNNALIKTSSVKNWNDYFSFVADKDAIYSYIKVTTQQEISKISQTYNSIDIEFFSKHEFASDEYGLVSKDKINYLYYIFTN